MKPSSFVDDLQTCLGVEWKDYVLNKRRGGDSGRRGVRYEDYYCLYQLAGMLCALADGADVGGMLIEQQAEAIVDDLVITSPSGSQYFQCKNTSRITWTGGRHPLKDDFSAQMRLLAYQGNKRWAKTILAVSEPKLAAKLRDNIPQEILSHTEVDDFPYCDGVLNRLVVESEELRQYLMELARVDAAADDQLADVLGALMYGLLKRDGRGTVQDFLLDAQSLSPHLIRLMPNQLVDFSLIPGFEDRLARIRGLNYSLSRGFFRWEGFGMSGVLPYHCLDEQFVQFQNRVLALKPATFDAFERLL